MAPRARTCVPVALGLALTCLDASAAPLAGEPPTTTTSPTSGGPVATRSRAITGTPSTPR